MKTPFEIVAPYYNVFDFKIESSQFTQSHKREYSTEKRGDMRYFSVNFILYNYQKRNNFSKN